jgi:amidase
VKTHRLLLSACVALISIGIRGAVAAELPKEAVARLVTEGRISSVQRAIVTRQTSCIAVVQAYLDRINAYDKSTGLNAIAIINGDALKQAQAEDASLRAGAHQGALFCVPVLVKDNIDTKGLATSAGSKALLDNYPAEDADIARRLKEAGAIIIAKTNMAEWAFSPRNSVSSSYGTTTNAYDRSRTPAGSSGGTASGTAASFGLVGIGSDTGNSVRGPSSFAALVGMRPTLGLVSRTGVIPLQSDRDTAGPMTRTVEDNARLLSVLAGQDPGDDMTVRFGQSKTVNYMRYLKRNALRGARIGVVRDLVPKDGTDPKVLAVFEQAIKDLRKAGATIVDPIDIPNLKAHLDNGYFCSRFAFDVNSYLAREMSPSKVKDVADVFQAGTYALESKFDFQRFLKGSASDPDKAIPPCLYYLDHPGRRAFLEDIERAMDQGHIDALIYPSWRFPPPLQENSTKDYRGDNSQLLAPPTGMPAITVPAGYTDGLPVGLQMLGRRFDEGGLYALAYSYEQFTHWRHPPPGFSPLSGRSKTHERRVGSGFEFPGYPLGPQSWVTANRSGRE